MAAFGWSKPVGWDRAMYPDEYRRPVRKVEPVAPADPDPKPQTSDPKPDARGSKLSVEV
jgi:hypothetical protein